ncbi:MAG TPA: Na+/H+ antiporter subunit E [Jatrophihabitans sp.]|nr:Na+/H+ antiporter subunit E [Jatrophihabitans sp.]
MVRDRLVTACSLFSWGFSAWLLLTWTVQAEQLVCGALVSAAMTAMLLPLMDGVVRPWALLRPRRAFAVLRLVLVCLARISLANLRLSRRIWSPSRPLASGMVVVPAPLSDDAGLAGVGLLSSLIVDNQLVDLDRSKGALQYHAVSVPPPDSDRAAVVTGGTERLLRPLLDGFAPTAGGGVG